MTNPTRAGTNANPMGTAFLKRSAKISTKMLRHAAPMRRSVIWISGKVKNPIAAITASAITVPFFTTPMSIWIKVITVMAPIMAKAVSPAKNLP